MLAFVKQELRVSNCEVLDGQGNQAGMPDPRPSCPRLLQMQNGRNLSGHNIELSCAADHSPGLAVQSTELLLPCQSSRRQLQRFVIRRHLHKPISVTDLSVTVLGWLSTQYRIRWRAGGQSQLLNRLRTNSVSPTSFSFSCPKIHGLLSSIGSVARLTAG